MKKSLLLIVAFIGFSAIAAETVHGWFDTELPKINGERPTRFWPTDGSDYDGFECVITNTAAGVCTNGAVAFSADVPMAVCPYLLDPVNDIRNPNPAVVEGEHYVDIAACMKMTPFSDTDLPAVPADAKAAVIAVDSGSATNFWVAAGTETLYWTNTMIAADTDRSVWVKVQIRTNDLNSTTTEWNLDGSRFSCEVVRLSRVNGVSFIGQGELSDCYADRDLGVRYVSFSISPLPEFLTVSIVDAFGEKVEPTAIGDYEVIEGVGVTVSYTLPDGWLFIDGASVWTESFTPVTGAHEPCVKLPNGIEGPICDYHFGPEDGWMLYYDGIQGPLLTGRYRESEFDEALKAMKDGQILDYYYSEKNREFTFNDDGSISVGTDATQWPAKPHYHYVDHGVGLPLLSIDDGESDVTSIREAPEDSSAMFIGTIQSSYEDFSYSVIYADDPLFLQNLGETEPVRGNGGRLELKAPKGENDRRFYRIRVSD